MNNTAGQLVTVRRILCPVDLSDFSAPALAHAVALGRWFHAEVTALHVFATWVPPASLAAYPGWMMHVPEAREAITQELRTLTEPIASAGVALRTADGDAAAEIVRAAADMRVDLIVMGTHGRSGFDRLTLGSVTEKVLRKATCQVLTLPPGAPRTPDAVAYQQIVCPMDFSDSSNQALDLATSLARTTGAGLTVLTVVDTAADEITSEPADAEPSWRREYEMARRALHALMTLRPGLDVAELVTVGKPYREILRVAADRHADVIVMGVRGRGAVDLTLFGSTTNQVVRRARCPVLTIRSE